MSELDRLAGVVVPVFSVRTFSDWGIGDFAGLIPLSAWVSRMGQRIVQILPILETAPSEASPYAAISAFAIDPIYLSCEGRGDGTENATAEPTGVIPRATIRAAKLEWLCDEWRAFRNDHVERRSAEGERFVSWCESQREWIDDYALFRALKERFEWRSWSEWPVDLRTRQPAALEAAGKELKDRVGLFRFIQWKAARQWAEVREEVARNGVLLKGDLPFVIGRDSADAWANPELFVDGWEIGAPPDEFSAEGQNWGLPLYNWPHLRETNFRWWRARIAQAARMYDLFRIDHIVGVFRTYAISLAADRTRQFHPEAEAEQIAQGEAFLRMACEMAGGARVIAEDLGTIPPWVRETMRRLGVPGYKVLRWERDSTGFIDPRAYDPVSVATTGTHDTTTLARWWQEMSSEDRQALGRTLGEFGPMPELLTDALRRKILARLYAAPSELAVVPIQDLFGWTERINLPMSISDDNWNYRLPFVLGPAGEAPAEIDAEGEVIAGLVQTAGRYA